jgi:hydroxyacylglutathione hydrolase
MTTVKTFTLNPFQVNTYIVYDETLECIIIDAASTDKTEEAQLDEFIFANNLKPVLLLSTHTHVDHIPGNDYIIKKYNIPYKIHEEGTGFLHSAKGYALGFGFPLEEVALPTGFISNEELIHFGNTELKVLYTPGHANGSVCFYCEAADFVIAGDVLFCGGIGRTDLPTGNHNLLLKNIHEKLLTLPKNTKVYCGHGPNTTIGNEKKHNPFLQG